MRKHAGTATLRMTTLPVYLTLALLALLVLACLSLNHVLARQELVLAASVPSQNQAQIAAPVVR